MISLSSLRKWLLIVGVILILALVGGVWWSARNNRHTRILMSDGRYVEIVGVTAGPEHKIARSGPLTIIRSLAPASLRKALGPNLTAEFGFSSSGPALWLMFYDPVTDTYSGSGIHHVKVIDEHGCEFTSGGTGGTGDGYYSASVIHLPVVPRRDRTLRCQLIGMVNGVQTNLAEIMVQNPIQGEFPEWIPEPLPARKTNSPVIVQLNSFRPDKSADVTFPGEPDPEWELRDIIYEDSTGNRGYSLCRKEKAWKWDGTFLRKKSASFSSNEIWTLPSLALPTAGKLLTIQQSNTVQSIPLTFRWLAGPGVYTFSNDVCTSASPAFLPNSRQLSFSSSGMFGNEVKNATLGFDKAFAVLEGPRVDKDVEVILRVRSGEEVVSFGYDAGGGFGKWIYEFAGQNNDWQTNSALTFEVIVHRAVHVEFMVSPQEVTSPPRNSERPDK